MIRIIESPREGMQGFHRIIPTHQKVRYIEALLRVGFDTVETGSIVSPKLIPQMADSMEVLDHLKKPGGSRLMMLAVNRKGAGIIATVPGITHMSYPFSFTPTFLKHNVNSTVEDSFDTVRDVLLLCREHEKTAVVYISMAFGNPYGDPWNTGLLVEWVSRLHEAGAGIIPLSNVSTEIDAELISEVYSLLIPMFPEVEFGLHLHTSNRDWYPKVKAAWDAGCRRFDGVINGWGGCPMAGREMLGNLKTENLLLFAEQEGINTGIDRETLMEVYGLAKEVFSTEDNDKL